MHRLSPIAVFCSLIASISLAAEPGALVATRTLSTGPVEVTLPAKVGRLQAAKECKLAFEVAGRLEILVPEGSSVAAGALVARLDADLEDARLRQAELRLLEAHAQLARVRGLIAAAAASQKALESAETFEALRRAERDAARAQRDRRTLVAPFDGVVVDTHFEIGEVVGPTATLAILMDLSELRLEVGVPGYEVVGVAPGARVSVSVPALPAETFEGTVDRVAEAAPEGRHLFEVEILIDNPSGARPGMSARARIVSASFDSALVLPVVATVERNGVPVVYVVENGTARELSAQGATRDGDQLILPADGQSRELVVRGQRALQDGMSVHIDNTVLGGRPR
jgi:membrane fusion protein (multidrug efflux system)